MINVQNDALVPYSSPASSLGGWAVNYKFKNCNIVPSTIVGSILLDGVLIQTFTTNQYGECTFNLVTQLNNWVKYGTFNPTTGFLAATWADKPIPAYSYVINTNYGYNIDRANPAYFPFHEDGN
jgi:hypothetical protein